MKSTVTRFHERATQAGFRVVDTSLHAEDYATTLAHWTRTFDAAYDDVKALGFDERFIRMWRYYTRNVQTNRETSSGGG